MFYSQFILAKKGPLGTIWIAAHLERKLRKNQVADTDIGNSVDSILSSDVPIALRLSSHLLLGVVKIYSRKVNYLFDDCSEALLKVKQAFRSAIVDLAPEESKAPYDAITLPETFDLDDFELPESDLFQGNYIDHHVSAREHITLQDTMEGIIYSATKFGLDERFCDGDGAQFGLELEDMLLEEMAVTEIDKNMPGADIDLASVRPTTPVKEDEINKGMSETSDPMTDNAYRNHQGGFFEAMIHVVESVDVSYDSPAKSFNVSEPSRPDRSMQTDNSNLTTEKDNKPDFRLRHCENAAAAVPVITPDGNTIVCRENRPHDSVNAVPLQVCAVDDKASGAQPAEVSCSPNPCKLQKAESTPSAMERMQVQADRQKNDLVGGEGMNSGMADIAALIASRYQSLEEGRRAGVVQLKVMSDFPEPEMFLSVPQREREAEGVISQPESGKKRSFTESTLMTAVRMSSHNSEESSGLAAESKATMNPVRDDGDLLSSILSGRQSPPVFSVRERPPSWAPPAAKRPRLESRIGPPKRKVLMDDSMILQADTVRKQLISTEDIRRLRKKAPCTVSEIWILHKLWMEEEVFSDPVSTGMASELTDLHGGRRSVSACLDDDVTESSTTVPAPDSAVRHLGHSDLSERDAASTAAPPPVAAAATDHPMSDDVEAAAVAVSGAVVEMSEEVGERRENHLPVVRRESEEKEEQRHSPSPAAVEVTHSVSGAVVETGEEGGERRENHLPVVRRESEEEEEQRHSPSPAAAEVTHSVSGAVVEAGEEGGERRESDPEVARRERDSPSPAGVRRENDEKAESPPAVGRESGGGSHDLVMRESGDGGAGDERSARPLSPVAADERPEEERHDLVGDNSHNLSPHASPDRRESGESSEAAPPRSSSSTTAFADTAAAAEEEDRSLELLFSLGHEESSSTKRIDPTRFRPDPNPIFTSHHHHHSKDPVSTAFDDTDFLRTDSCCMPTPEEEADFNGTGWSGRTRAVAKYLQTVFAKGGGGGDHEVALDRLLSGKTAKEASRMFFETLVLKTRDYIHVKQEKPLEGICVTAQPKLTLTEF